MFNFSESELAQIRINDEESGLYDELKSYLYDGDDESTKLDYFSYINKFYEYY